MRLERPVYVLVVLFALCFGVFLIDVEYLTANLAQTLGYEKAGTSIPLCTPVPASSLAIPASSSLPTPAIDNTLQPAPAVTDTQQPVPVIDGVAETQQPAPAVQEAPQAAQKVLPKVFPNPVFPQGDRGPDCPPTPDPPTSVSYDPPCAPEGCAGRGYLDVVVARYNEPMVDWLPVLILNLKKYDRIPKGGGARLFIYNKMDNLDINQIRSLWTFGPVYVTNPILPNIGREGHPYLLHTLVKFLNEDISEYTLFLQGGAEEVVETVWPMLEAVLSLTTDTRLSVTRPGTCTCTGCNSFWTPTFFKAYELIMGKKCDGPFLWSERNQFMVSRKAILDGIYEVYFRLLRIFYHPACHKMHQHSVPVQWLNRPDFQSTPSEPYWAHGFERLSVALFGCASLDLPSVRTSSGRYVKVCPEGAQVYRLNMPREGFLLDTPEWHYKQEDIRDDDWKRRMLKGR